MSGSQGDRGDRSSQGDQGDRSSQGDQGDQGDRSSQGDQGDQHGHFFDRAGLSRAVLGQALVAAALTGVLYSIGLSVSPPHLMHDEVKFALQARTLAETGRNFDGRFLPVYFPEPGFAAGRDPMSIYVTAAVLKVLPLSEWSVRLPSALVGAVSVGLMFLLARLWFGRDRLAWIAAALLALTPAFFIHSRLALSVVYPVPFMLLWLMCLTLYLFAVAGGDSRASKRYAWACGIVLGFGVYSYLAAALLMPLYLLATLAVMAWRRDWRAAGAVAAGFAILMAPILWWQLSQPDRYGDLLTSYQFAKTDHSVARRVNTFWDAFNPSRLFFSGESSLNVSTRQAGLFLLPLVVFLAAGLYRLLRPPLTVQGALVLFGLVSSALPAVIMADVEIRRWLVMLPFAVLAATYGADRLLERARPARAIAMVLLALMVVQFVGFGRDYFGGYRQRASFWFGGNIRGALEAVLNHAQAETPPAVYLSKTIPYIESYWDFYAHAHGAEALLARTVYPGPDAGGVDAAPARAMLVMPSNEPAGAAPLAAAGWSLADLVREPDGTPSFAVYTKTR